MRQGDADVVCPSASFIQPWMSGGDSYSRVCLPMQRPGGSIGGACPIGTRLPGSKASHCPARPLRLSTVHLVSRGP